MIEIGTKVKVKFSKELDLLDDYWFNNVFEVQGIENSEVIGMEIKPRYFVKSLYFFEDELEVYTPEEFPEYYI